MTTPSPTANTHHVVTKLELLLHQGTGGNTLRGTDTLHKSAQQCPALAQLQLNHRINVAVAYVLSHPIRSPRLRMNIHESCIRVSVVAHRFTQVITLCLCSDMCLRASINSLRSVLYLCQGGYVMLGVCLSVCLSICLLATLRENH